MLEEINVNAYMKRTGIQRRSIFEVFYWHVQNILNNRVNINCRK